MPTLKEINDACGDVPAFILHLYDRALLNGAALRAAGITKDTPDPPGAVIERDRAGNPHWMFDRQSQRDDPVLHSGKRPQT